ncbi:DUF4097 family beta strand repeat-containing protein [Nesterenkonia ebinurensis]|uniref:DUF4097 family beta strand repeat-containing protein n=1 Tax=Nesterenkonia ebinurensis TaxID=2608252 RepID=UPI00123D6B7A|nr:DUF4097 family beta strand repeat-containing protein [Nesterenkonia ebinurensis]
MATTTTGENTVLHTFDASGPQYLDAQLRSSSLNIATSPDDQITVKVTLAKGVHINADPQDVIVEYSAGTLRIEVPETEGGGLKFGPIQIGNFTSHRYTIDVQLPESSSMKARTGSGSVTAAGLLDQVTATCGSGRIAVERAREISAKAGSGAITVDRAEKLEATAGSGAISVSTVGEARLTAGSGSIRVSAAEGRTELKTGSGAIRLGRVADTSAFAGSGDIEIGQLSGRLTCKTGSGDVSVQRAISGIVEATAASGDIEVGIPAGTAVLQDCSTVSGRLSSALENAEGPGEAEHRLELRARTISGDVSVHRA